MTIWNNGQAIDRRCFSTGMLDDFNWPCAKWSRTEYLQYDIAVWWGIPGGAKEQCDPLQLVCYFTGNVGIEGMEKGKGIRMNFVVSADFFFANPGKRKHYIFYLGSCQGCSPFHGCWKMRFCLNIGQLRIRCWAAKNVKKDNSEYKCSANEKCGIYLQFCHYSSFGCFYISKCAV